jgi:type II secretory pathway pseudopilin PulG
MRNRQSGFSLLEVVIAAAMLFVIIGITATLIGTGNNLVTTTSLQTSAEMRAADLVDRLAKEVRNGVLETLRTGDGTTDFYDSAVSEDRSGDGVTVRLTNGYSGGPLLDKTVRVILVAGESSTVDGRDNDNDGYIDEFDVKIQKWDLASHDSTDVHKTEAAPADYDKPDSETTLANNVKSLTVYRQRALLGFEVVTMKYDPPTQTMRTYTTRAGTGLKN